jgi:hypothetical protein
MSAWFSTRFAEHKYMVTVLSIQLSAQIGHRVACYQLFCPGCCMAGFRCRLHPLLSKTKNEWDCQLRNHLLWLCLMLASCLPCVAAADRAHEHTADLALCLPVFASLADSS